MIFIMSQDLSDKEISDVFEKLKVTSEVESPIKKQRGVR